MVVIADTSPLNYLVLIGQAEILPQLYGEVVIPEAVLAELQHPNTPRAVADWVASRPVWLLVERDVRPLPDLPVGLDPGESEAISLAQANRPDTLLLIDEEKGRKEAERRNIPTTGTLGVLDLGAANGLLDLPTVLERLQTTNYVAQRVLRHLLDRDAHRRQARDRT